MRGLRLCRILKTNKKGSTMSITDLPHGVETIASKIYEAVEPVTKVGQILRPIIRQMGDEKHTHWLRSGAEGYSCAIVVAVEPKLQMVSPQGDMLWCTDVHAENYEAIAEATPEALAVVMRRLEK